MDIQAGDISHHVAATIPLSWGPLWRGDVVGAQETTGAYSVGARTLEEMKVLGSYLMSSEGELNNILKILKRNGFQSRMFRLSKTYQWTEKMK